MIKQWLGRYNPFVIRHAASVVCAVAVAMLLGPYIGFTHGPWLVLASYLVCQTTRGTPLKQGLVVALFCVLGVVLFALTNKLPVANEYKLLLLTMLLGALIWFARGRRTLKAQYYFSLLVILLTTILYPLGTSWEAVKLPIVDMLLGSFIALVCTMIILPVQTVKEFLLGVVPTLTIIRRYSEKLAAYFEDAEGKDALAQEMQWVRQSLESPASLYPNWVYEVGFNRGLRAGFRYYLIKVESLAELVFSLDYLLEKNIQQEMPPELHQLIAKVANNNAIIISTICRRFETKAQLDEDLELVEDIEALEARSKKFLPSNIELLNLSESDLHLVQFIRDLKDMRTRLLQLATATP